MCQPGLFDQVPEPERSIQERFERYDRDRPEVYQLFRQFALELRQAGRDRYSADAILHRIRWYYAIARRPEDEFRINDHFSSRYARKLAAELPEFANFFETRTLKTP